MLRYSAAIEGRAIQSRMRLIDAALPASAALRISAIVPDCAQSGTGAMSVAPAPSMAAPRIMSRRFSLSTLRKSMLRPLCCLCCGECWANLGLWQGGKGVGQIWSGGVPDRINGRPIAWPRRRFTAFRGNFQPSRHRNLNLANGLLGRRRMGAAIFEIGNIGDPAIVLVRPEQVDVIMGAHGVIISSPLLSIISSSCRI